MRTNVLTVLLFYSLATCAQTDRSDLIQSTIEEIRQAYAPDKRVAIFNVSSENRGQTTELSGETNLPEAKTDMLNRFKRAGIEVRDNVQILEAERGIVNVSVCNIRSEPRHSAELSTQSLLGTPIKWYKNQNSWFYVQTPDGYLGWLDDGGFTPMDEPKFKSWQKLKKVVFMPSFGFAYVSPNTETGIISDLTEGNILAVDGFENGEKIRVRFPDDRIGYVDAGELMPYEKWMNKNLPDWPDLERTAHSFMGRPYMWGGTSGKGIDCSGFTKMVYYLHGLELPRDASQQGRVGVEVETDTTLSNLIPGDFLFFGRSAAAGQPERISHVAIYLGDGKMIHASDRVQIQSLKRGDPDFVEYRLKSLVRARRMLENVGNNGVVRLRDHPDYSTYVPLPEGDKRGSRGIEKQ